MNRKHPLALAAALMLAGEVCAQAETTANARATIDERMGGVAAGTRVQNPAGEAIGTVADIVPNVRTGRPGYVVIATASGLKTAVPYAAIVPKVHDGHIVLDRSRLERAPSVRDSELQDHSNTRWQKQADQYWSSSESTRSQPPDANDGRSSTPPEG
jgi:hypothetical protein